MTHPAIKKDNVAVITGAADGIGLATAHKLAGFGMKVIMADIDADKLKEATQSVAGAMAVPTDVSQQSRVIDLKDTAYSAYGRVDVLMNNAGTGASATSWTGYEGWETTLKVNLWGVINGIHAFVPSMLAQNSPGLVINTGSKQGITCPPGAPAYNVSKAAIKAATEALQHEFRNTEGCQLSAHLLVPGFTYTGMIRKFMNEKPDAAWTSEQVADFLLESVDAGDFYVLCPDNDVDRATDNKRMAWAMGDLIENRPPLSRWHPDYAEEFEAFMKG